MGENQGRQAYLNELSRRTAHEGEVNEARTRALDALTAYSVRRPASSHDLLLDQLGDDRRAAAGLI